MESFVAELILLRGQKIFFTCPEPSLENTEQIAPFDVVPLLIVYQRSYH